MSHFNTVNFADIANWTNEELTTCQHRIKSEQDRRFNILTEQERVAVDKLDEARKRVAQSQIGLSTYSDKKSVPNTTECSHKWKSIL